MHMRKSCDIGIARHILGLPAEERPLAEACLLDNGSPSGALLLLVEHADIECCFCQAATCAEMPWLGFSSWQVWLDLPQPTGDMGDMSKASHTAALLTLPDELVLKLLPFRTGASELLHTVSCFCKGSCCVPDIMSTFLNRPPFPRSQVQVIAQYLVCRKALERQLSLLVSDCCSGGLGMQDCYPMSIGASLSSCKYSKAKEVATPPAIRPSGQSMQKVSPP